MKKVKIRILTACLLVSMLLAVVLSGCGTQAGEQTTPQTDNTSSSDASGTGAEQSAQGDAKTGENAASTDDKPGTGASQADDKPAVTEPAEGVDSMSNVPEINVDKQAIPDNKALEFVKNMKIGWNLGNTFDAIDCNWLSDELAYESAWCGVKTTDPMIKLVKDAGFNTIRIPVSWHNHVSGDDHKISEAWLNRVQEVVDYAIGKGMHVIINIHHDMSEKFIYPTSKYMDQSKHYVVSIWSQLADRFKDYDDHLIFESLNEPRMVGHKYEWWIAPNDKECEDAIECINTLNQAFVDTVRATGGNNAQRYLMVPGYDASYSGALDPGFRLPTDTVPDKMIVSVHAYTPYNFALEAGSVDKFDVNSYGSVSEIDDFMTKLYNQYVSNGIPVVIGEFGARNKKNNLEDRVDFSAYYIASARARGITCIWWDNNSFTGDGELFGIFDRKGYKWKYPEIVDALMKYAQ